MSEVDRTPTAAPIVCEHCRGRGWLCEPDGSKYQRCEMCVGIGYVGLRESIADAGDAS